VLNGTRWRTEIQPRIREFIRTIQFKRRVGPSETMRMSLPYRGLKQDREAIVEYQVLARPNGAAS
jgi:poly(3-hydroxybutyrate) depolymerase